MGAVRMLPAAAGILLSVALAAEDPFQAIRNNNFSSLRQQIQSGADVNLRDRRGATLLMHAAAFGSPEAVKLLLESGADPNARNQFDATALMWAASDLEKVRLLVDHGANVNVRSKQGRTPLLIAAAHDGASEIVKLLAAKGADLQAKDGQGDTALMLAAVANDTKTMRLLVERGAEVNSADTAGDTALMFAAANNNLPAVKLLLSKGADVNAANRFHGKVKNGEIALVKLTPLHFAADIGSPELIRTLIAAGAKVNAPDIRGMTPLMLAAASEAQDREVVRILMSAGAEPNTTSLAGETTLDWARKFGYQPVIEELENGGAKTALVYTPPKRGDAAPPRDARVAVERSTGLLQRSASAFFQRSGCVGCHHQNAIAMAVGAARANGIRIDEAAARENINTVKYQWAAFQEMLLQRLDPPGSPDQQMSSLFGLAGAEYAPDAVTDVLVVNLAAAQQADGSWALHGVSRAPMEENDILRTAMAVRSLQVYGMPGRKAEFGRRILRARSWLLEAHPRTSYDRAMHLAGLHWAGAGRERVQAVARELTSEQRSDGGWAQNANLASDAYATGLALYALRETGSARTTDAVYRKGVDFLLRTQFPDGSWYVRSRAVKFQPYFQSGFPFEHDQWISSTATAWAVMALAPVAGAAERARR